MIMPDDFPMSALIQRLLLLFFGMLFFNLAFTAACYPIHIYRRRVIFKDKPKRFLEFMREWCDLWWYGTIVVSLFVALSAPINRLIKGSGDWFPSEPEASEVAGHLTGIAGVPLFFAGFVVISYALVLLTYPIYYRLSRQKGVDIPKTIIRYAWSARTFWLAIPIYVIVVGLPFAVAANLFYGPGNWKSEGVVFIR